MPRVYHSSASKCPFYRGEDCRPSSGGATLLCNGIAGSETVRLFFRSKAKLQEHTGQFCRKDWKSCAIAKLLENPHQEEPE